MERQAELQNAPGAEWNYNNTGYGLLALVVERVTGTPFQDWMRETVFEPLGMDRTVVRHDPDEIVPGRATGYASAEGGRWEEATGAGRRDGRRVRLHDRGRPAPLDGHLPYAEIGGPAVLREMTTRAVLTTGDTTRYGLGLYVGERKGLRDDRATAGPTTATLADFAYYPEIESGVVVLTNSPSFPARAAGVAEVFFADAFAHRATPRPTPRPRRATPSPLRRRSIPRRSTRPPSTPTRAATSSTRSPASF